MTVEIRRPGSTPGPQVVAKPKPVDKVVEFVEVYKNYTMTKQEFIDRVRLLANSAHQYKLDEEKLAKRKPKVAQQGDAVYINDPEMYAEAVVSSESLIAGLAEELWEDLHGK